MKFWEEKGPEATLLAIQLERGFDVCKVGLAKKEVVATAVNVVLRTLEVLALCLQACLLDKPSFHKNCGHSLEHSALWVPFWEIEQLRLTIWRYSIGHISKDEVSLSAHLSGIIRGYPRFNNPSQYLI